MKVLHILNELRHSGAETMLHSAISKFNEAGIESHILATGQSVGDFKEPLEKRGYIIHHIPFKRNWAFLSPSFRLKLYRFLKKEAFDVIHIHPERGYFGNAVTAKMAGTDKIIRTVHHIFPLPFTLKGIVQRPVKIFQRWFLKNILNVIITSNSQSGYQNELATYFNNNIIIPNWYDDDKFKERTQGSYDESRHLLNIPKNKVVFMSLGGNWEYKNYDLIVKSFGQMNEELNALYLQVGPDPDKKLEQLNETQTNNVRLEGMVDDIMPYLYASDVYMMPSKIEGFGVAAVEAMGVGLPAVLSDRPALYDFKKITDEILYIEPTVEGITKGVKTMLNLSFAERWQKGQTLSKAMSENYGLSVGPEMFIKLYKG